MNIGIMEKIIIKKPLNQSNMKQTAVEWLQDTWGNYPDLCTWDKIQEWFEQAKEMEKEQIIAAAADHSYPTEEIALKYAEQYYNETFKSE